MYSELECGICYWTFNAGRRCPRELHCKHSFCESCLLALSRAPGPEGAHLETDRLIVCPLCRHTTVISEGKMRAELRVDECALERLLAAGLLYREEDDDPKEGGHVQDCDDKEEALVPEAPAEESQSPPGGAGGRIRWSRMKVWRRICGKSARQGRDNNTTSDDLRHFAMMSCYMF